MARPKKKHKPQKPQKAVRSRADRPMRPTPERMAKAGEFYVVGGDGRVIMRDSVIERAHKTGKITARQLEAARRYRLYWHHAGLEPGPHGVDLNRVYAPDHTGMRLMAQSERQAEYRQQYRRAVQCLGLRISRLVEKIACEDATFEDAGRAILGWTSKPQAISAAVELFREGCDRLADFWRFPVYEDDVSAQEIA